MSRDELKLCRLCDMPFERKNGNEMLCDECRPIAKRYQVRESAARYYADSERKREQSIANARLGLVKRSPARFDEIRERAIEEKIPSR